MAEINNEAGALNRAPPLTVENILKVLEGVEDWKVVARCLGTYYSTSISLKKAVEQFLQGLGEFQPSWRPVIFALDGARETPVADRIRSYGEPVQDPTLTTDSVTEVMEVMNNWDSLDSHHYVNTVVPSSLLTEIQQRCSTKREIANECASYYIHYHPQSSWTHLASHLYRAGEIAAMEKSKPFLPLRDLTITTEKLVELFAAPVREYGLDKQLDLPQSKVAEMRNLDSPFQRRVAYLDLYTTGHPCPSWRQVAEVLRWADLDHQADTVESMELILCQKSEF